MKCKKCNTEIQMKESTVMDANNDYRLIEYGYCSACDIITNLDGSPVVHNAKEITNEEDLILWARGSGSNTSVGVKK